MEAPHHQALRRQMVEQQIAGRGVRDQRVLEAMLRVPRHDFMPAAEAEEAYADRPGPIDCSQTISQPYMVGLMTQMLELRGNERVLEIGAGSGYQTAVLCELAREVLSIERHAALADAAGKRLYQLGYRNVRVICGDGTRGYPDAGPYDAILVTAGGPAVPQALLNQLAEGGRLVCPIGDRRLQRLLRVRRSHGDLIYEQGPECVFVPLVGADGWPDDSPQKD